MRGQTYAILAIIIVIIVAVFAVTNVEPVEVNYLFWTGESPLILVILFSVLMGGIITAATGMVKLYQNQRQMKTLREENKKMREVLKKNGLEKQLSETKQQEEPVQNKKEQQ
ncbi:LapA family protein [Lentibacillus sediminis]|uniref:LapA family protein n=1 Tax=Lentibacillus sediminis TaxID=1940529 RepID=UPI000C1BD1A9|nr:lipopolysaccharide assembly protein LapA domain-containing protein [Lentibacillus sediminis]